MNENKKIMIVGIFIAVVALIIPIVSYVNNKKTEEVMDKFYTAFEKAEKNMIYVGRDTCSYCQLFSPELKDFDTLYDIDYTYINTDEISSTQLDEIFKKLGINASEFGTPYVAIVQDGKVVDKNQGFMPEDTLFTFLQKNELIDASAKAPLNYISYDDYKNLLNSNTKEVIVFGQMGCSACESARPSLFAIAKEYNVKINYFNLSYLKEEQSEEFGNSLAFLNENEWGTPLMVVVENKKVVANVNGADTKENYVKFLKDNGFIK
ncbi:MAG: hypothetical protein ACM3O4_02590 [Ignavibacteriales bacterium]